MYKVYYTSNFTGHYELVAVFYTKKSFYACIQPIKDGCVASGWDGTKVVEGG